MVLHFVQEIWGKVSIVTETKPEGVERGSLKVDNYFWAGPSLGSEHNCAEEDPFGITCIIIRVQTQLLQGHH